LMLAVEEMRSRRNQHSRRFYVTAKQLGGFLQSVEAEELLLKQRRADREARRRIAVVEGGLPSTEADREGRKEWSGVETAGASAAIEEVADEREEYEEF
jgi:hypothetical protein